MLYIGQKRLLLSPSALKAIVKVMLFAPKKRDHINHYSAFQLQRYNHVTLCS
jgi:hypothetical protein